MGLGATLVAVGATILGLVWVIVGAAAVGGITTAGSATRGGLYLGVGLDEHEVMNGARHAADRVRVLSMQALMVGELPRVVFCGAMMFLWVSE